MMQGIGSMAALSSTDPLSSMRFQLQPRKSLPDRNASVFIVSSDGRFSGGVNPRSCSVKKLVPNAVAAPADSPASAKPGHELLLFEALREGLEEEMDQDPQVCVMGEDVGHYGGSYKVTKDLAAKYGDLYVLDIPIALIHGYGHWSSFDWLKANCRRHEHGFPTIGLQPDLTTAKDDVSWVLSTCNAWNLTSSLSLAFRWSPVPLPTTQRA